MWKAEEQLAEIIGYRRIITRLNTSKRCRIRQYGVINIGTCFQAEIPDFDEECIPRDRQDSLDGSYLLSAEGAKSHL